MDIKDRRKALGWSRADLAGHARVDPRTLQLIELGHSHDDDSIRRCEATLGAVERGEPVPDWSAEIAAMRSAQDPTRGGAQEN